MSSRRVIFLGSIVLFVGLIFITIFQATGLEFTGSGFSFTRGSALSILTNARAEVFLNGKASGDTPLRLTHISPGLYTVTIQRNGYIPWQAQISLTTGKATILGPITLVPTSPTTVTTPRTAQSVIMVDPTSGSPFIATPGTPGGTWRITDQSHGASQTLTLPASPTAISRSPHGSIWAVTCGATEVLWTNNTAWTIPVLSSPTWTSISDTVLFGIHDGHLFVADALAKSTQDLGAASSLGQANQSLWSTVTTTTQTTLIKHDPSTPTSATTVTTLDGSWSLLSQFSHHLILQSASGQTVVKNISSLNPNSTTNLGTLERLWWDTNQTPLWQNGADVLQLDTHGVPALIDRWSEDVQAAWWQVPDEIVLLADKNGVTARGTTPEEGQHILGHWSAPGTFLSLDQNNHAWYTTDTSLIELSWR